MSASESFIGEAQHCATLFRLGRDVEAGLAMTELVAAVHPTFDSKTLDVQQQWTFVLGQMFTCQEAQNWLALADYLEYELVELLTDSLSL
ncbi:hypothetical protein [Pseudomonas arsenicoxydans]|uniref:Uncharacterized protein n=1 Tax=Pseudomonas arsenicoxydans TaxID=702115 RepID=A0A502HJT7_9PSED|nr:hypothetical protein [Pseudomonas arsenicoxydans]TPG73666.1 hypothetical protein EAH78_27275 [Pseudomonas arsenicoxydans]